MTTVWVAGGAPRRLGLPPVPPAIFCNATCVSTWQAVSRIAYPPAPRPLGAQATCVYCFHCGGGAIYQPPEGSCFIHDGTEGHLGFCPDTGFERTFTATVFASRWVTFSQADGTVTADDLDYAEHHWLHPNNPARGRPNGVDLAELVRRDKAEAPD